MGFIIKGILALLSLVAAGFVAFKLRTPEIKKEKFYKMMRKNIEQFLRTLEKQWKHTSADARKNWKHFLKSSYYRLSKA